MASWWAMCRRSSTSGWDPELRSWPCRQTWKAFGAWRCVSMRRASWKVVGIYLGTMKRGSLRFHLRWPMCEVLSLRWSLLVVEIWTCQVPIHGYSLPVPPIGTPRATFAIIGYHVLPSNNLEMNGSGLWQLLQKQRQGKSTWDQQQDCGMGAKKSRRRR